MQLVERNPSCGAEKAIIEFRGAERSAAEMMAPNEVFLLIYRPFECGDAPFDSIPPPVGKTKESTYARDVVVGADAVLEQPIADLPCEYARALAFVL